MYYKGYNVAQISEKDLLQSTKHSEHIPHESCSQRELLVKIVNASPLFSKELVDIMENSHTI